MKLVREREIEATELEKGMETVYGIISDVVFVSDLEVIVAVVNNEAELEAYDSRDEEVGEQINIDPNSLITIFE